MHDGTDLEVEPASEPVSRDLDIRVRACEATGFVILEGTDPVAAFSTSADLCRWLEDQLRVLDPPMEKVEPPAALKKKPERMFKVF